MEAIGDLATFSATAAAFPDALFFRSVKNPSHEQVKSAGEHPQDWECIAYDGAPPDTEDALGLPKGTFVIFYSREGNASAFYRVRGVDVQGGSNSSVFKQSMTLLQDVRLELAKSHEELARSESVQSALADELEKERKKRKKVKKKLEEAEGDALVTIAEIVAQVLLIAMGHDPANVTRSDADEPAGKVEDGLSDD